MLTISGRTAVLCVSVAKVVRDRIVENWKFSEPIAAETNFGSGYPSDPLCKKWMEQNRSCQIFGFPDVVRFSWGPAKKALDSSKTKKVVFEADVDEDENADMVIGRKRQQEQMSAFLGRADANRKRLPFFERKKLLAVTKLV